jgi:hypothetical protein
MSLKIAPSVQQHFTIIMYMCIIPLPYQGIIKMLSIAYT